MKRINHFSKPIVPPNICFKLFQLLFRLAITSNPPKTSAQISSAKITASQLKTFVEDIVIVASKLSLNITSGSEEFSLQPRYEKSASSLATSLMHDINFPGNKSRKV